MQAVKSKKTAMLAGVIGTLVGGSWCHSANAAMDINFSNLDSTSVTFSGGAFNFTSNAGYQFSITDVTGGLTGDSVGLDGYVSPGGPFTIGTITTAGSVQSAPVTGSGTLHITDAHSIDLTGTIQWDNITTFGTGGFLDVTGTINLTGLSYAGTNSDLSALLAAGSASDVVSFQFNPAQTLTQLDTTGGSASYSGSIAVPEPSSVAMGLVGAGSLIMRRTRRKNR